MVEHMFLQMFFFKQKPQQSLKAPSNAHILGMKCAYGMQHAHQMFQKKFAEYYKCTMCTAKRNEVKERIFQMRRSVTNL